jgi:5-methylcytosine-specific restriction endonuclease McrA
LSRARASIDRSPVAAEPRADPRARGSAGHDRQEDRASCRSEELEARRERQREYRRYLKTEGWKQRRQVALDRAAGFCEDCGARTKLEVHHRTYERRGAERPEDLVAVCGSCHEERHRGKRTTFDWIALSLLRWWRLWRYRTAQT